MTDGDVSPGQTDDGAGQSGTSKLWDEHADHILASAALSVLVAGTIVYRVLEGWSWVDSFYFCTVAVTTVGFGDLTPTTDASKLFTVLYIFSGVAVVGLFLNERLKQHGKHVVKRRQQ